MTKNKPRPPGEFTLEQFEALRPFARLIGAFNPELKKQLNEVERRVADVRAMMAERDRFANVFGPLGWVNYDRMAVDVVSDALSLGVPDGEAVLTAFHLDPDTLRSLGGRFRTPAFRAWSEIYERAVERAAAEDFLSAVPLVLIVIDGICTTTTGKHPFSGGADAPVFDTSTSGPGGLSAGLALFGATRRKLDVSPISVPYRHGVVHGLNPDYGHAIVAAKAFNLLQAMVDYLDSRRDEHARVAKAAEEQRPVSFSDLGRSLARNAETRKRIDAWRPRPVVSEAAVASSGAPARLEAGSPEEAAASYLRNLATRNYGALAKATVDYPKRAVNHRAGRLREDLADVLVLSWTITGVEDTAAAMTRVTVTLSGSVGGEAWTGEHSLRLMYSDHDNGPIVRGTPGGDWLVMPDFVNKLAVAALKARRGVADD